MSLRSPTVHPLGFGLVAALLSLACVDERPLTPRTSCSCAPGWTCDANQNVCHPGTPQSGDAASDDTAPDSPGWVDPTADPNCSASPMSYQDYQTREEFDALLIGRWKRCIAPQIDGEDVGVEFTADGHYYPLTRDTGGQVVRRTGVDYERTWQFFAVGEKDPFFGNILTRPVILLDDVLTDAPRFTNDPRQLRINLSPVLGRYLPLDR